MKKTLSILTSSIALAAIAPASTVAHWQFNDLTDSSGNGHTLTDTNTGATISGGSANFVNPGGVTGLLSAPDNAVWDNVTFTVEATFTFNNPSPAGISTLASHLSDSTGRQWLFGTNTTNVPVLLLRASGASSETAFASSFGALVAGNTYYFGAAVDLTAVDPANRITFYFRDITNNGAFQTQNISTTITALNDSTAPLAIGSTAHQSSRLVGSIDELRISDTKLGPNDLLIAPIPEPSSALLTVFTISLFGLRRRRA